MLFALYQIQFDGIIFFIIQGAEQIFSPYSNRKTVTIPDDSTVYIGASFDYLDLGAIFGDTLRVVFADSLEYTFFKYDYDTNINSRNPYKFYRWSNVQVGGGPNFIYDRTFTVDESFRE